MKRNHKFSFGVVTLAALIHKVLMISLLAIWVWCCPAISKARWSREHLYRDDIMWAIHLRADSSPQFSRDYLVTELDYVCLDDVYSLRPANTLQKLTWTTRILPVQVLGRKATSTAFKFRALLRSIHLETGNVNLSQARTFSFLNDMGVESKLALLPDIDSGESRRAFPNTLPLHDVDHALHHVMEELRECWNPLMFDLFEKQLNTLAKYFSKADNCERFRKHFVYDNPKVEGDARKRSIAKMFETCCPTFIKHRWQYRYEVLTWVTGRSAFLMWLDPTSISSRDDGNPEYVFSDAEIKCLELLFNDVRVSSCFWALAHAMRLLCEWGHGLSGWMHGCHCHPSKEAPCLWLLVSLSCNFNFASWSLGGNIHMKRGW